MNSFPMKTPTLGEARFDSKKSHTTSDEVLIPERIEVGADPGIQFELAGPRAKLFFDPKQTRAGIVTCGGLCPGLDNVIARGVNILFTVGGDGTQRGAHALYQEARKRGHALSVVGVPKTIDNDVAFVSRTFGFFSAIEESARVLECAHTEARSVPGGIGLVKLMGRHAGFVTAGAVVANQDVNFALIPEVSFKLESFLAALKERMREKSHAVIAVAEGAGQDLLKSDGAERDASGNVKPKDVGLF